jgi:thymidylate kinase
VSERVPEGEQEFRSVAADVATAIDRVVDGPVLVIGSLPPEGRDLDLLAKPSDHAKIIDWLHDANFVRWRDIWARFDPSGLYGVELSSADRWRTRRTDASSLFIDAEPLPGFDNLCNPSPATVLLLAARGGVTRRGRITAKVRSRISQALERDPRAWDVASERAGDLGLLGALHLLRESYQASGQLPLGARTAGLAGVLVKDGPLAAKARILVGARPRRPRPPIISFSGLDGSGKSTQVDELQDRLHQLGVDAAVQWGGSFKSGQRWWPSIPLLNRPLGAGRRTPRPPDPFVPSALRDSRVGQHAWVFVVAGLNTIHLWRLILRHRGSDVLIFDRFSPDSMVKMDMHFHRFRNVDIPWQRALFTFISPKPDVGFLVDVSSEIAYSRRQEQTQEQLAIMSELYQEQVGPFRLHRLDGTEPADALSELIAVTAWRGLR